MSTKRLREVLKFCAQNWEDSEDDMDLVSGALAELEAIERAATTLHRCDIIYPTSTSVVDVEAAVNLFASIAKEGK